MLTSVRWLKGHNYSVIYTQILSLNLLLCLELRGRNIIFLFLQFKAKIWSEQLFFEPELTQNADRLSCIHQAERHRIKTHYTNNIEEHLNMLCDLVCTQKKQIDAQREKLQLQKEHIQLQKEAFTLQRQDLIDVRSHAANGEFIWRISDFTRKLMDAKTGRALEPMISEPFYTHPHGYKVCAGVWLNGIGTGRGRYISVGLQVLGTECFCDDAIIIIYYYYY